MIKYCICCRKNIEVSKFGIPKNAQEIWGHDVVCDKCCSLIGIPQGMKGALIASTYNKERVLKEYVKVRPEAQNLLNVVLEQKKKQKQQKNEETLKRKQEKYEEKQKQKQERNLIENEKRLRKSKHNGCKEKTQEKYICCNCGEIWYVGEMDVVKNIYNATTSKLQLSFVKNFAQCPKCGSSASTHKTVKYWVDKKGNCVDKEE